MALFAISDLHLAFLCDKPMDIFKGWDNYVKRIEANWRRVVSDGDTVVLPGDLSWALKLEDAREDFLFLNSLPGKKIILKGNHDLWWSTASKMHTFLDANGIDTVSILHNNFFEAEGYAICGTRGWLFDGAGDRKVLLREAGRLEASLKAAEGSGLKPLVFMHYPPAYDKAICRELFDVLHKYNIKTVFHGHIHGKGMYNAVSAAEGVTLRLVSCDCIDFCPYRIV